MANGFLYILRRFGASAVMLLAVLLLTFLLLWALPGDPTRALLGEKWTPEAAERMREAQGLDDPLPVQFVRYLRGLTRFDLGRDQHGKPVVDYLRTRLPATIELTVLAMLVGTAFGMAAGVVGALGRRTWRDTGSLLLALVGVSLPIFWLGLMAKRFFRAGGPVSEAVGFAMPQAGRLGEAFQEKIDRVVDRAELLDEPARLTGLHLVDAVFVFRDGGMFLDALAHVALPALVLATVPAAIITRVTRAAVLEQLGEDFARTARAKGVGRRRFVLAHVLRPAMVPIVTSASTMLGYLVGGAVLTERVFAWPGIGTYVVDAIVHLDAKPLQACILIVAVALAAINLAVDLAYPVLDPRVRLQGAAR